MKLRANLCLDLLQVGIDPQGIQSCALSQRDSLLWLLKMFAEIPYCLPCLRYFDVFWARLLEHELENPAGLLSLIPSSF